MASAADPTVVNLFKKVYGQMTDLIPEDYLLQTDIPWRENQKVGETYVEAVVLTAETGWTLGGSAAELFDLNPPISGSVQQASVIPYQTVLSSLVPWGMISRSAGAGEKAFKDVTKYVVRNNLKSHGKLLEIIRIYGQYDGLLGYVSYYTGVYRGVSFTNGTGTLTLTDNSTLAFTNGINAAEKAILFRPGYFAAGIWVGIEGAIINEVNASNVVVQSGKITGVDPLLGIIYVDFTPTAPSAESGAGSMRLCFQGMEVFKEAIGVVNILTKVGSLFGISTSQYSLWHGNSFNCQQAVLSLKLVQNAVAVAVARGGLEGDIVLYVNPRSWARFSNTEAGLRVYDQSYQRSKAENGFEAIEFWSQTGKITVKAHRMIMEGQALGLHLPDWSRSGSAEISFKVPGMSDDLIYPAQNQNAYIFRSYADQYVFCRAPAKSIWFYNINDEAA